MTMRLCSRSIFSSRLCAAPARLILRERMLCAPLVRHVCSSDVLTEDEFQRKHNITIEGEIDDGVDMRPVTQFSGIIRSDEDGEHTLPSAVRQFFKRKKFDAPTPIQAQSLPLSLAGQDLVAIAQTGSGKTLAFLIPLLWDAALSRRAHRKVKGPLAVVMAPTRELAQQIHEETQKLGGVFGATSVCVFGGQNKRVQERNILRLGRRLDIVVATPGRLADLMRDQTIKLDTVRFLVLDEADRMLDMGFEPQLREIADELPPSSQQMSGSPGATRQTMMFSATWPEEVRQLSRDFLNNPVRINVGGNEDLVANSDITQFVQVHRSMQTRLEATVELVEKMEQKSIEAGRGNGRSSRTCHSVVFVNRKIDAEMVAERIRRDLRGVRAEALHGDLSQMRRDRVRDYVKRGSAQVLVATDVASRGLDVKTVAQVVNFDMPTNLEDYVHRIGRTARAGAKGESHTLFDAEQDKDRAKKLAKVLKDNGQDVPLELAEIVRSTQHMTFRSRSFRGRGRNNGRGSYGNRGYNDRGGYGGGRGYGDRGGRYGGRGGRYGDRGGHHGDRDSRYNRGGYSDRNYNDRGGYGNRRTGSGYSDRGRRGSYSPYDHGGHVDDLSFD